MDQIPIKFQQKRDFSEIFNATFSFLKQEYKLLGKAIFRYAVPVLIVASILSVFVSIKQQELQNDMAGAGASDPNDVLSYLGPIYLYAFLSMALTICALGILKCVILGYLKLYTSRGQNQFTAEDIRNEVKTNFLPVLGMSLAISLLIVIGFILCVIPGIIIGVSLSLILQAYYFEDLNFGTAFNRSFKLTGPHWWLTLGLILVFYILMYMIVLVLSIPAIAMGFKSFFWAIQNAAEPQFSTGFYIVNSVISIFTYIVLAIPSIGMTFYYFSLVESIERPSLQDKIEQIG